MIGQSIQHYLILEHLSEGGMGVVYKARDTRLNRLVVLKCLRSDRIGEPEARRRFLQEAVAASALNHPNIVVIYDIQSQDDADFIVMEYVQGRSLDAIIADGALTPGLAVQYARQIASALEAAHSAGIVHRDLKPANVMVSSTGLVKLLDWGLAKLNRPFSPGAAHAPAQTAAGSIIGTVAYMSPEQALGRPIDGRSDLFGFGALLYEMLTGMRAFAGESPISTLSAVLRDQPPRAGSVNTLVSSGLERVLARCLEKEPRDRFASATEMLGALDSLAASSVLTPESEIQDLLKAGRNELDLVTPTSLAKAKHHFERAMRLDEGSAEVFAAMSEYYITSAWTGIRLPSQVLPKAQWAAQRAIALDNGCASAQACLGVIHSFRYSWSDADACFAAGGISVWRRAMWYSLPRGRVYEATAEMRVAVEQNPLSRQCLADLAFANLASHDPEAACQNAGRALHLRPDHWFAHWVYAFALIAQGRADRASTSCQAALLADSQNAWLRSALACALAGEGLRMESQRQVEALAAMREARYVPPELIAIPLLALGEKAAALEHAMLAVELHSPPLLQLIQLPALVALKEELLRAVALPLGKPVKL